MRYDYIHFYLFDLSIHFLLFHLSFMASLVNCHPLVSVRTLSRHRPPLSAVSSQSRFTPISYLHESLHPAFPYTSSASPSPSTYSSFSLPYLLPLRITLSLLHHPLPPALLSPSRILSPTPYHITFSHLHYPLPHVLTSLSYITLPLPFPYLRPSRA